MKYVSTRGGIDPVDFQDAVMMGLADDGGLLVPARIPDLSGDPAAPATLGYRALAERVMAPYIGDIPPADLSDLLARSYGASFSADGQVAPVVSVGPMWIQELWHGPTLAFKDVALQLLGHLFEYILAARNERLTILGATSGDTGSAAIEGVRGREGIEIFMMHPAGRVSSVQERQMTSALDLNVHNIAVAGSFDDCQEIMKSIAGDLDFKRRHTIGAVNSVNWARVLAQIVYYFYGALRVCAATGADRVRVAVPTGNFGNILAGWYAAKMGAPIEKLILATNENDILARFFNSGDYSKGDVYRTINPSMDIQVASNFERYLYYRLGGDPAALREKMAAFAAEGRLLFDDRCPADLDFTAASCREERALATISRYYTEHGYLLDPHTAAGVAVAESMGVEGAPLLCLATAHPAKFPEAVERALGTREPARHPAIDALAGMATRCAELPADAGAVREYIERTVGE